MSMFMRCAKGEMGVCYGDYNKILLECRINTGFRGKILTKQKHF